MCICQAGIQEEMLRIIIIFQSCLEQVEEVLSLYQPSNITLVLGDIKASLREQRGNARGVMLKKMMADNSLKHLRSSKSALFHPNKTDNAEID